MKYQGKKVLNVKKHHHSSYGYTTRVEIVLEDYSTIEISIKGNGLELHFSHTDPPKPKPWIANEKKMLESLSDKNKEKYREVRKAFFWLIKNINKFRYHYKDKNNERMYGISYDDDVNNPEDILTIFLESRHAPECDCWFRLGRKSDWKDILKTYKEVSKG